ncbi:MAG: hypothetical protein KDJ47_17850 [Hyphomicrobiaceae bacterium]|nr:hypothetical protein [Hyphomicrobiaceae bacterium]
MQTVLASARNAAAAGVLIAIVVLALAAVLGAMDAHMAGVLTVRALHVLAAMIWAGLIVFVNVVQLAALKAVTDAERPIIVRHIAGPSARVFTGAAHATLATGIIMAIPLGGSLFHRPVLLLALLGGLVMWAIVQFVLRPNVARITGKVAATDAEKGAARTAIATWARVNLMLVIPVTVVMLVAAHAGL